MSLKVGLKLKNYDLGTKYFIKDGTNQSQSQTELLEQKLIGPFVQKLKDPQIVSEVIKITQTSFRLNYL